MIRVVVFTDDESYRDRFAALDRSRSYSLEFYPKEELRTVLRSLSEPAVLYYDLEGESQFVRERTLRFLTKGPEHAVGVIDSTEEVPDPAELFHIGAVDYIGPGVLEDGVGPRRVRRAVTLFEQAYGSNGSGDDAADSATGTTDGPDADWQGTTVVLSAEAKQRTRSYRPSGLDWQRVFVSQEYTFLMLYSELDIDGDLRRIWSTHRIEGLAAKFRGYLERELTGYGAHSWIWSDTACLFLIPFDGERCPLVRDCVRLMLSQTLMAVERLSLSHAVGFRLALTVGDTIYEDRGRTGDIISDSVNFVFHLGRKYLEAGQLLVDEEALWLADPQLHKLFSFAGRYEGRELYRMHRVL